MAVALVCGRAVELVEHRAFRAGNLHMPSERLPPVDGQRLEVEALAPVQHEHDALAAVLAGG